MAGQFPRWNVDLVLETTLKSLQNCSLVPIPNNNLVLTTMAPQVSYQVMIY